MMDTRTRTLARLEFEARIFISLTIVALACAASAATIVRTQPLLVTIGGLIDLSRVVALRSGFLVMAGAMAVLSLLRMWAGSELTARRVMAFRIQTDRLARSGPYLLVRNPIYLSDFLAVCCFAICLPPVGLLMPVLFLAHYLRLIDYEEQSLGMEHRAEFERYAASVPRLFPSARSLAGLPSSFAGFRLTKEGVRHNALYLLFIPGFAVAAVTGEFLYAAGIGLPGVIDWAVVHTRIGVRP